MSELRTEFGAQASNEEDEEIDQMIRDANCLIQSVYRGIQQYAPSGGAAAAASLQSPSQQQSPSTPPRRYSSSRGSGSATISPKTPARRPSRGGSVLSPSSREIELQVERINRFVDTVDYNLRTIGPQTRRRSSQSSSRDQCLPLSSPFDIACLMDVVATTSPETARGDVIDPMGPISTPLPTARRRNRTLNTALVTATPEAIIDLSETQSPSLHSLAFSRARNHDGGDDDDVIIVSSNLSDVVDLCTSGYEMPLTIESYATAANNNNNNISSGSSGSNNNLAQRLQANIPQQRQEMITGIGASSSSFRSRSPQRPARDVEAQTSTTNIQQHLNQIQQLVKRQQQTLIARISPNAVPGDGGGRVNVAVANSQSCSSVGGGGGGGGERTPFMCPVCMDSTLKNSPTSTKCGHVFCGPCIREAIRLNHKCPMCNTKLKANMLFRIYW